MTKIPDLYEAQYSTSVGKTLESQATNMRAENFEICKELDPETNQERKIIYVCFTGSHKVVRYVLKNDSLNYDSGGDFGEPFNENTDRDVFWGGYSYITAVVKKNDYLLVLDTNNDKMDKVPFEFFDILKDVEVKYQTPKNGDGIFIAENGNINNQHLTINNDGSAKSTIKQIVNLGLPSKIYEFMKTSLI